MTRAIFVAAILAASSAFLAAQQSSQANPYQGVSAPPPNSSIVDQAPPQPKLPAKPIPKPHASHYPKAQTAQPSAHYVAGEPNATVVATPAGQDHPAPGQVAPDFITSDGTDGGIVEVPSSTPQAQPQTHAEAQPETQAQTQVQAQAEAEPRATLHTRATQESSRAAELERLYATVPDGGIVHPKPLPPGTLGYGTVIRVRLLNELASGINEPGDTFHSQVVDNVYQDGKVLIPAGSEIDGRVTRVSTGDGLASSGYMDLRPETVTLPSGQRFRMYAMVSGTSGSNARVGAEGKIKPGGQWKRYGYEYGGGVGAGAATGAIVGGPVGAITGTLIGAAAITAHLLISHPQATLDRNSMLTFTLTEPLNLVAVNHQSGE